MRTRDRPAYAFTGAVAVAALLVTLVVGVLPFVRYAYEAPALHVAIETANSLIAMVVGYLVYGRFRRTRRLQELLLVCSLTVVAVANLLLTAIPTALALSGEADLTRWASVVVRFIATLLLVAAALTPASINAAGRKVGPVLLVGALLVTLISVLGLTLGDALPPPVDPAAVPSDAVSPTVTGHPVVLGAHTLSALLYAVAAVAFTRRAEQTGDVLLRWVGAGCVLAAFARVNYLLFPSLYSDFVYVGDLMRFGYYLLLLVGAAREVSGYWAAHAHAAVLEDRRRLARDLHDGLTQELSYIWSQSRQLSGATPDPDAVNRINSAAARALDEARSAIAALTRTSSQGFHDVLLATTDGLASRYDAKVALEVDESAKVSPAEADAVLRIVAEAFRNAVLHGGASRVTVELTGSPLRLAICDDGSGFDPEAGSSGGGFGLTSMRERAEGLGAEFSIRSRPGGGTDVIVVWA